MLGNLKRGAQEFFRLLAGHPPESIETTNPPVSTDSFKVYDQLTEFVQSDSRRARLTPRTARALTDKASEAAST